MCSIPTSAQRYAIPILYTGGRSFRQANAVLRRWKNVDKCWKWMKVEVKYPQCNIHLWWCCLFILAVKFVEVYCIWALGSPIRLLCMWTLICELFLLKWKAPFVVIHCRFNTGDLLLFYIVIGDSLQIFYCGWLWATGFNLRQKMEEIVFRCSAADERLFWSFRHQSVISLVMISSRAVFWTQPVGMVN